MLGGKQAFYVYGYLLHNITKKIPFYLQNYHQYGNVTSASSLSYFASHVREETQRAHIFGSPDPPLHRFAIAVKRNDTNANEMMDVT